MLVGRNMLIPFYLQLALAPTGRVLFLSRHPAMLGVRLIIWSSIAKC